MKAVVYCITETDLAARALARYLRCFLADQVEVYYKTYRQPGSAQIYHHTDLFVLDLFNRDDLGYYVDIRGLKKLAARGRKVLTVSGAAESEASNRLPFYWDLAATDALHERVRRVLAMPAASCEDIMRLQTFFAEYCRTGYYHPPRVM